MHIIPLSWVITLTGLSRTQIYTRMEKGIFPKSILITDNLRRYYNKKARIGWIEHEVNEWLHNNYEDTRLINIKKLKDLTNLPRRIIFELIKKGEFPKPIEKEFRNSRNYASYLWADEEIYKFFRKKINRIDSLCVRKSVNQGNDDDQIP